MVVCQLVVCQLVVCQLTVASWPFVSWCLAVCRLTFGRCCQLVQAAPAGHARAAPCRTQSASCFAGLLLPPPPSPPASVATLLVLAAVTVVRVRSSSSSSSSEGVVALAVAVVVRVARRSPGGDANQRPLHWRRRELGAAEERDHEVDGAIGLPRGQLPCSGAARVRRGASRHAAHVHTELLPRRYWLCRWLALTRAGSPWLPCWLTLARALARFGLHRLSHTLTSARYGACAGLRLLSYV